MSADRGAWPARDVSELLVLCYHAVSDTWPSPAAISPSALHAQLRYLLRLGYRPLTLSAALGEARPRRAMVVTFDDAYTSIPESGLPVLERLGVPATVFVPTDAAAEAGQMAWSELAQWVGGEHEHELRCMSWDELRGLAGQGWEVGSHTCSHPHLTEAGEERLADELWLSRAACENELQQPCTTLAYPFGSYDAAVMDAAAAAGYRAAVTLDERIAAPLRGRGPLEVPREAIYRATGWPVFAAKTSRLVRRIRVSRPYASLT
ncbi:MAG: polysaccharide deacetylase family protein [Solirubrobacterales bacterium]